MADLSASVQLPSLAGAAPTYVAVSAADYFVAPPSSRYILHYKNGATTTGGSLPFKIGDPTTQAPAGSGLSAGFADAVVAATGMLATTELVQYISNTSRFRDANGRVNLSHGGTLTTVTVAIIGPLA